jgi:Leucine-rich repeat (LRR) protein
LQLNNKQFQWLFLVSNAKRYNQKKLNIQHTKLAEDVKQVAKLYKLLPSHVKIISETILETISSNIPLSVTTKNTNQEKELTYNIESSFLDLHGKNLTSLSMLPLKDENETQLVANILDKVTYVDASNNYLSRFPAYFFKMKNLKKIFLANNNIKYVSSSFGFNNTNIETLDLSNNKLTSYSTNAFDLPQLQYLNLSGNYNLYKMYIEKEDLLHLKELNIKYTKLAENSERIAELYKLLPSDVKIIY